MKGLRRVRVRNALAVVVAELVADARIGANIKLLASVALEPSLAVAQRFSRLLPAIRVWVDILEDAARPRVEADAVRRRVALALRVVRAGARAVPRQHAILAGGGVIAEEGGTRLTLQRAVLAIREYIVLRAGIAKLRSRWEAVRWQGAGLVVVSTDAEVVPSRVDESPAVVLQLLGSGVPRAAPCAGPALS